MDGTPGNSRMLYWMQEITHFGPLVREPSSHISITWVSWSRETIRNLVFPPKLSCWIHLSKRNHAMTPNMFWLILCVFIIPHRWKSLSMNGFLQDHHIFVTVTNWAQHSKATSAFAMEPMGFLFMASCTRISAKPWQHGAAWRGPLKLTATRCYTAFDKSLGSLSLGHLTGKFGEVTEAEACFPRKLAVPSRP